MNDQQVIDLAGRSLLVAGQIAAPALLATMITGLVVSIFQAATQINEQTLAFIPKIVIMTIALALAGPWILSVIVQFTLDIFNQIPSITR